MWTKINVRIAFLLPLYILLQGTLIPHKTGYTPFHYTDSLFIANTSQGWAVTSSYLQLQEDSVVFELILSRNIQPGNYWNQFSPAGTISGIYRPSSEVTVQYNEPTRIWAINILPNGQCSLKLMQGPVPAGNPCIIPFQTKFKK